MKRRWWLIPIGMMFLIAAGGIAVWQLLISGVTCSSDTILQEMDTLLHDAQNSSRGAPLEEVNKRALRMVDLPVWNKLQSWVTNSPGSYQIVLLALDQASSPGDDAMVGIKLSNGVNIECTFYNRIIVDCVEIDKIIPPEERMANGMKQLLQAARDHPTGSPPKDVLWAGFLFEGGPARVWTDLQHWMSVAPEDFQVEVPAHVEHQCEFVEYTVKAHLSNGPTIACKFSERFIQSCEEVK